MMRFLCIIFALTWILANQTRSLTLANVVEFNLLQLNLVWLISINVRSTDITNIIGLKKPGASSSLEDRLFPYCTTCQQSGFSVNTCLGASFHSFKHLGEVSSLHLPLPTKPGYQLFEPDGELCAIKSSCRQRVLAECWRQKAASLRDLRLFKSLLIIPRCAASRRWPKSASSHFVLISVYCHSAEIKAVQGRKGDILDEIHYISREC